MKKTTKKSLIVSSLAVAVQGLLFASLATTAQANTTTYVKKPIGDLEIYQSTSGGKITIMMMLDTSGSMVVDSTTRDRSACELDPVSDFNQQPAPVITEAQTADRPYTRTYCAVSTTTSQKIYSYVVSGGNYYNCDSTDKCEELNPATRYRTPPSISGLTREFFTRKSGSTAFRYYKLQTNTTTIKHYDRLTRLKDAIFALMDAKDANGNYAIDPTNVAIGIGQFSSQTTSNNTTPIQTRVQGLNRVTTINADNVTGKIVVPAALLDDAQRQKIKDAVAKMWGAGGTPAAAAYAEAGAYMLGTTTKLANNNYGFDYSVTTSRNANNYISPLADNAPSCDGQGIYFLTDGQPNNAENTQNIMAQALGSYPYKDAGNHIITAQGTHAATQLVRNSPGIMEIANFSRLLRDASGNPKKRSIRTAVVGFGSIFDISQYPNIDRELPAPKIDAKTGLYIPNEFKKNKKAKYLDCSLIQDVDARNACNWGAKSHPQFVKEGKKVGGYGEGGFYSAQSMDDIIGSVKEFLGELEGEINPTPSGTISIPDDPYSVGGQQAVAYMPMIEPKIATQDMIWPGNMKKYHLANGTIWGKNAKRLYTNVKGDLNPEAQDGWSESAVDNNKVTVGGFYAHLKNPKDNRANIRQVYIEDFTGTGTTAEAKKPKLRKLGVNAQGKITLDDSASNTFHDTTTYTLATVKYLLHFLGFTDATVNGKSYSIDEIPDGTALSSITLQAPTDEIRVLGASPHSTPTTVSYGAALDANTGNVSLSAKDREDYVLFGSMDGALHLVDARDRSQDAKSTTGLATGGEEVFAFIPKVMIEKQARALQFGSTYEANDNTPDGQPVFGVDAPWAVMADYDFDNDDNPTKMVVNTKKATKPTERDGKGIYAYGGFRLGGEGLYGLNLSAKGSPELAFALTPQQTGFERLGQIWAKPVSARIKTNGVSKDVIIFGGGYDLCYENEDFQVGITNDKFAVKNDQRGAACSGKTEAIGNAVYMVDAQTGTRLWTATHGQMKHSVVGGVTPLDRDNDGNIDAIYFADLGGQVFRADFDNSGNSFAEKRVTRLLKPAGAGKMVRRFYEKPVVSIYRADQTFKEADAHKINHDLFALVNVVSGDRSNPTSKMRTDLADADRLYGIFDTDIGGTDFYTKTTLSASEIEDSQLENLSNVSVTADVAGVETKRTKINTVKTKKGWYQPIVDFDGYTNVRYGKGIGKSEVIGSLLFSSVYNPDKVYAAAQECTASIKGGTERQMYCLPYGVCLDARSTNGKGGFSPAGQGISELTLGPLDGSSAGSRKRVVISNVGLNPDSSVSGTGRVNYGEGVTDSSIKSNQSTATTTGGSGSDPTIIFDHRFTLQPLRWYDNSVKN